MYHHIPLKVRIGRLKNGKRGTSLFGMTVIGFCLLAVILTVVNTARRGETDIETWIKEAGSFGDLAQTVGEVFAPTDPLPYDSVAKRFSKDGVSEVFADTSVLHDGVAPVKGRITSAFGFRKDPFEEKITLHNGIDIGVAENTPVSAFLSGTVTAVGYNDISGRYIVIDHGNRYASAYCHLNRTDVNVGDSVKTGEKIALSGATGEVTGPHLHFRLSRDGTPVDPCDYIDVTP